MRRNPFESLFANSYECPREMISDDWFESMTKTKERRKMVSDIRCSYCGSEEWFVHLHKTDVAICGACATKCFDQILGPRLEKKGDKSKSKTTRRRRA